MTPTCPFCGADAVEQVAPWGGQIITSQWRCALCGSYFEAIRADFDEPLAHRAHLGGRSVDGLE
jgi:hypothetical protein